MLTKMKASVIRKALELNKVSKALITNQRQRGPAGF